MTTVRAERRSAEGWATSFWGGVACSPDASSHSHRAALVMLLAIAFGIRMGLAWVLPNIHQADEVYQVAEQATQALRGYGVVSWEFQAAARPAFLATMVVPIYQLPLSPAAHQLLVAALFSALSLLPVWVAFRWSAHLYGLRYGLLAGVMMATWFELVYFAPKPTADVVGAYFFLTALYVGRPGGRPVGVFAAAALLMLTIGVRMQIAPAVLILLLLVALVHGRRRPGALAAGVGVGLALVGGVEWWWWGMPFQGHIGYLAMEFGHHVSDAFGRQPLTFYAKNAVLLYGGALPLVLALVLAGTRRAPVLLVALIALALPFHAIGHKEYRFLVVCVPVMVLLVGLGTADVMTRFAPPQRMAPVVLVGLGWLMATTAIGFGDTFRPYWTQDGNAVRAFRDVGRDAEACGVALVGVRWYHTPGYSGLGRDIPIYEVRSDEDLQRLSTAANFIFARPKAPAPPPPFVLWRQYSRPVQNLYRRPGGCVPDEAARVARPPLPRGTL